MFKAETPGPMKDSKMTPRIAETAKGLWLVYLGVTIACIVSYHWAGMDWFDAFAMPSRPWGWVAFRRMTRVSVISIPRRSSSSPSSSC